MAPSAKITAAAFAAFITAILVWALGTFGKIQLPPEVATAVSGLITVFVGWAVPEAPPAMTDGGGGSA